MPWVGRNATLPPQLHRDRTPHHDPPAASHLQPRSGRGWPCRSLCHLPLGPGELDLPLLLAAASAAVGEPRGTWANAETLLAYEYRAAEKLFRVTRKLVNNQPLKPGEARSWRERYCVDLRTRSLHGPEDYVASPRPTGCGSGRAT